jgi:hypothetical protein
MSSDETSDACGSRWRDAIFYETIRIDFALLVSNHHLALDLPLHTYHIDYMASNGHANPSAIPAEHFLFTSESVGEGHPGAPAFTRIFFRALIDSLQTRSAIRFPMLS